MKKVLLVGDLRTAINNYGAFANSDMLVKEFKKKNIELKCIDFRSFWNATPEGGWSQSVEEYLESNRKRKYKMRNFARKLPFAKSLASFIRSKSVKIPHVPYLYKYYDDFSSKVLSGKALQYEKALIEWSDIVVINGEGNIVRGTDKNGFYRIGGLYVLYMAYLSKKVLNKETYIINHTIDPGNRDIIEIINNLYNELDGIYIREKLSIKLLNQWGIENVKLVPDSLFLYNEISNKNSEYINKLKKTNMPVICIGDSSGIQNGYSMVKWNIDEFFITLINKFKDKGYQIVFIDGYGGNNEFINKAVKKTNIIQLSMSNCGYEELYNILKLSKIYISGRWHTSILSLIAHTPILLWGSDSHKTEALYDLIDYQYKFFDASSLPIHVSDIVDEAIKIINADHTKTYEKVNQLQEQVKNITEMI